MLSRRKTLSWRSNYPYCSYIAFYRRVRQLTHDNQMYLQKIIEMKDEQAEAFNQANSIYIEAQKMKNEQLRASKLEEEKGNVVFGND